MNLVCRAPAKVNLRLRIVGKREDGYHFLEMLNAPLALCDSISITLAPGPRVVNISMRPEGDYLRALPAELDDAATNIAARAALAVLEARSALVAVQISIVKRIPLGGGLGGGSSDAAAVIRALASVTPPKMLGRWGPPLTGEAQNAIGVRLGADIPYFLALQNGSPGARETWAWIEGIGEVVAPLSAPAWVPRPVLLLLPGVGVATAHAYRQFDAQSGIGGGERVSRAAVETTVADWARFRTLIANDFEPVVAAAVPEVRRCLEGARLFPELLGFMSGSGSTVVVVGRDDEASAAFARLSAWATKEKIKVVPTELLGTLQNSETIGSV